MSILLGESLGAVTQKEAGSPHFAILRLGC